MTILIVDDDHDLREMVAEILSRNQARVIAAADAASALDCLNKQEVDLILSDVEMPGLSGFEFLSRVRKLPRHPPVYLMSGILFREEQIVSLGAKGFLQKPFNEAALREFLKRVS